ncbi:uncharacterized protein LOC133195217 [Saccostrea echinata]|uniref:uncharacterized protein LOC133195217 n=1 Tax=Saccostrea echinata TaxID=191078 RepID=UPI002A8399D8|nr:uncharacterized protein LOC133195217 [Saccostrea echinata]
MAASGHVKECSFCLYVIKDRGYRALSSKTSTEQYNYAFTRLNFFPTSNSYACNLCTNKLNRISKIEENVRAKVEQLKTEREKLLDVLRQHQQTSGHVKPSTPRVSAVKRSLDKTPTPKGKSKKALFKTPDKLLLHQNPNHSLQSKLPCKEDKSTQTHVSENFDVKIVTKIAGADLCVKKLKKEIDCVVSKKSDLLKCKKSESMMNLDWSFVESKLKEGIPYLFTIMSSLIDVKKKQNLPVLIMSIGVLLYGRSRSVNQLQYILGLTLDKCGVSKEGLKILHDLGISVASSTVIKEKKQLIKEQEKKVSATMTRYLHSYYPSPENPGLLDVKHGIEIIGDNLDVTITPAKMTMMSQRKSLHWFLTMVKEKRIMSDDKHPRSTEENEESRDILKLPTSAWLPSSGDLHTLIENMKFHIIKVLITFVEFLKPLQKCVPGCITHDFMDKTRKKSVILNCDLVEASENSSEGMITILQNVNKLVFQAVEKDQKITDRVVFGGDVLTNERAFTAQEAMQNAKSDYDMLGGLVHRPEGFHREMNFLLGIFQLFYTESSASDQGSLYKLRNAINRRSVTGPKEVTNNFRSHHQFIQDVTDSYIVSTFLDIMDMEEVTSQPSHAPVFSLMNNDNKMEWITNVATDVLNALGLNSWKSFLDIRSHLVDLSTDDVQIDAMKQDLSFSCAMCGKTYIRKSWLKKHLLKKHNWIFHEITELSDPDQPLTSFLRMSLLYRDTCDAYKMGDGDRIMRNAKFEWLYASALSHSKYKLWLWRMLTYVNSILPPDQAFEYMWNMTVNLKGGIYNNIPNDNCVELQVRNIKRELNTQGANKSFQSAKTICMTTQVIDSIKDQLLRTTKIVKSSRHRPDVDKTVDIITMVKSLRSKGPVSDLCWESFSKFKDPIHQIDILKLHEWINEQKNIADLYM